MEATDWKSVTVHMMDFEGSPGSGVVEYGVVELKGGRIQGTTTGLCHPVGSISARDWEVHGISELETKGRAPFSDLYEAFVGYRRSGIFAAHNRHAENTFLKSTWPLPPTVPDWRGGGESAQEWGPWIDTLSIYKALYPRLDSYALGDLVGFFGGKAELDRLALKHCPPDRRKPHCALYDALASTILLLRLEGTEDLKDRITVGWLLQLSEGRKAQQELF
ncbi:MAG TPA: 3'-5' exonuclease [Oceanipulchritudo sp.]|nr:3'-5' exonuclease [Oceanipulchritudo sp.]